MDIIRLRIKELLNKPNKTKRERELMEKLKTYDTVKAKQTYAQELRKLNTKNDD